MAERRLAITIKGAVSLGAYEAGVIAETLRLIAFNNDPDHHATHNPTRWYIDAACGASAGSMTSAMLAAALVTSDTGVFHRTWVSGVSIGMLAPRGETLSPNTILDVGALDSLAHENLKIPTVAKRHAAMRPAPSEIKLRLTLSRFAPDVISEATLNKTRLQFREYKDSADFSVGLSQDGAGAMAIALAAKNVAMWNYAQAAQELSGTDAWAAMVQTAIASGSFPFAFAPRDLRRWADQTWGNRYFQDGGTFDNDPVGETINIAHDIDWSGKPEAQNFSDRDRRFMMIHVEPFDGASPGQPADPKITLDVNPLALIKNYFPSILDESENSGLRGIVTVNRQIVERLRFLTELADLVANGGVQDLPPSILNALAKHRKLEGKLEFLRANMIPDLAPTDPPLFAKVSGFSTTQMRSFIDLALAYDLATDLADKVALKPILIAPTEVLSGSGLYAFGGFLVDKMRERDYAQGVFDAYQTWKVIAEDPHEFVLAPDAPAAPPTAGEIFPSCEDEYRKGIEHLITRVDAVIGALSNAATDPGILGAAESKIVSTALDAIAKHYLRKQGDSTDT